VQLDGEASTIVYIWNPANVARAGYDEGRGPQPYTWSRLAFRRGPELWFSPHPSGEAVAPTFELDGRDDGLDAATVARQLSGAFGDWLFESDESDERDDGDER
jgi:hypothetical protein